METTPNRLVCLIGLLFCVPCFAQKPETIYIPTDEIMVRVEYVYRTANNELVVSRSTERFYKPVPSLIKRFKDHTHKRDLVFLINRKGYVAFYVTNINEKCFRFKVNGVWSKWFYIYHKNY